MFVGFSRDIVAFWDTDEYSIVSNFHLDTR